MRIAEARRTLAVACGLAVEARIVRAPGVRALACGGDVLALATALRRELEAGASGVMSFGMAGGLIDDIRPGTWLVGRLVVGPAASWPTDAAWQQAILARLPGARLADLAGRDAIVAERTAKHALQRSTGAAAVDTESHVAAALAAEAGVPFAAFRVIADPASRSLPPATAGALRRNGTIAVGAVLVAVSRAPWQVRQLARTARDAQLALRALSRGRRLLGASLGHPNLGELGVDVR